MKPTRWERRTQAALVVAIACFLPMGCASSTAGVGVSPNQYRTPAIPTVAEEETSPGDRPDGPPPSDPGMRDRTAAAEPEVPPAPSPGFALDIDLEGEPQLRVLADGDLGAAAAIVPPAASPAHDTTVRLTADLSYLTDQNQVPEGMRIYLRPPAWDDLDPWEKTGLAVTYASSIFGAAYLLYSLFH